VRSSLPTGAYVFGDFCTGEIFMMQSGLDTSPVLLDTTMNISSFGQDESGEIYVVGLGGTVHRIVNPETVNCRPITVLPAVITVQGVYCFTGDLTTAITTGHAIEIQTNNVVLDLNGFTLGGLGAGLGTNAVGLHALDRQNITIKNGTIRGFLAGIMLEDAGASQGHVVEDMRADQNTYIGIDVQGSGNIVRNNQVVTTGGSTVSGANANAYGIVVTGPGPRVLNNNVITTVKQGSGTAWGIYLFSVTSGLVVNNRITEADKGIEYFGGSTGKYRDNLTFTVTTPFTGGTNAGDNS
jgi:hypothetical protein